MRRLAVLLLTIGSVLAGCQNKLIEGAENIRVLRRPDNLGAVTLVGQKSGTVDRDELEWMTIRAKNFAYKHDGDVAVLNIYPITPTNIHYQIDAYKTNAPR